MWRCEGLTLTPLIRALGLHSEGETVEEMAARRVLAERALERLDELAASEQLPEPVVADQRTHLEQKLARLDDPPPVGDGPTEVDVWTASHHVRREVIRAERSALLALRNQGKVDDEVARRLERELDLDGQRLNRS